MGKIIWIVNAQAGSPGKADNPRYLKFAKYFMDAGYDVVTFNSSQREKIDVPKGKYIEKRYGDYNFVHVFAPNFVGNGVKRMWSLFQFARNVKRNSKHFYKPDIILHNIHPPFDYPIVKFAKKLKCRYIAEAWDLWPEDFVTFGLVKPNSLLIKIAYSIEKKYYYAADEIVFTIVGAFDYLKRQGWMKDQGGKIDPEHLHYINNGIDIEQFDKDRDEHPRTDEDLNNPNIKKIIYLGSISKANNVKTLIDAAAHMIDLPQYRFFIYGNGSYRPELEQYVKDNHIDNVVFKETRIPFEECAWVVSQATVNVMNYDSCFGRWGVSSGKMFQYLAGAKPIICNVGFKYDNVIKDNNLGFSEDINSSERFVELIRRLAEQPQADYEAMCKRVSETAKRFDYKVLCSRELKVIES